MSEAQPLHFIAPEDQARANLYGLLGRLLYAAPDAALLAAIAGSGEMRADVDSPVATSWKQLLDACTAAGADAVREEFEQVFVGTGKAEVTLYVGAYTTRSTADSPLAELRGELAALGIVRREDVHLPEDHLGTLCETMRYLIADRDASLEEQQRFYARWVAPAAFLLCDAIEKSPNTVFYKHVGRLARSFFALEQTAFEMT